MNAKVGTPLWAIDRFGADALTQILNDLERAGANGLSKKECDEVLLALGEIVNAATGIHDTSISGATIWKELQNFADQYEKWNMNSGAEPEKVAKRKNEHRVLRRKRHRVARRIHKNRDFLDHELDLKVIRAMYGSLERLAGAVPDVFKFLAQAVDRVIKKLPSL